MLKSLIYNDAESFFAHMTKSNIAKWHIYKFQYSLVMLSQSLYLHLLEMNWHNFSQKCLQISKRLMIRVILNVEQFLRHKWDRVKKKFLTHSLHVPQFLPCNMLCLKCFVYTSFHGHLTVNKSENDKCL